MSPLRQGLVQVYTGQGKGKTTAAFGLAMRASGQGLKVRVLQFMKEGSDSGERTSAAKLGIEVEVIASNFIELGEPGRDTIRQEVSRGISRAKELLQNGTDVLILDELITALQFQVADLDDVLSILDDRPSTTELVLTGRGAPDAIKDRADLVTEMMEVKHPYNTGTPAREGIEY